MKTLFNQDVGQLDSVQQGLCSVKTLFFEGIYEFVMGLCKFSPTSWDGCGTFEFMFVMFHELC